MTTHDNGGRYQYTINNIDEVCRINIELNYTTMKRFKNNETIVVLGTPFKGENTQMWSICRRGFKVISLL